MRHRLEDLLDERDRLRLEVLRVLRKELTPRELFLLKIIDLLLQDD